MKFAKIYLLFPLILFLFNHNSDLHSQTWWHAFRSNNLYYQKGYDICNSINEYFYIVGYTYTTGPYEKVFVTKINKYGNIIWTQIYLDSLTGVLAMACASSNDGGCIVSGLRNDHIPYAIKINADGAIIWNKTYENHNIYDRTVQIIKTNDNAYLLCGLDYLLKIDTNGNYLWSKSDNELGYSGNIYSVVEAFDNNYICLGYQYQSPYPTVTKVNINGDFMWQKTYTKNPASVSLIRKLSNCYLLMGNIADSVPYPNTNFKYYFAKIDTAGNEISYHSGFDSTGKIESFNRGYHVLNDNRFIFTSFDYTKYINDSVSYTNFKIVDSLGNIVHKKIIEHIHWGYYEVYSVLPLNNGYIMYAGSAKLSKYSTDIAVFMARSDTTLYINPVGISSNNYKIPDKFILFQNFPNPFNPATKIKYHLKNNCFVILKVHDILGKELTTLINEFQKIGIYEITFSINNTCNLQLSSGIYFYSLYADNELIDTKRMIIIK